LLLRNILPFTVFRLVDVTRYADGSARGAAGSRFELKDRVTLRPFESYVVANAATQALLKSLRLDGIVTGTELAEIPADNSFRAWTADGRLHLSADHAEKVAVYHVSGTLKCYLPLLRGETTIALPSGIYLVRQGGTTIKVVL